jgi:hypothetical protein
LLSLFILLGPLQYNAGVGFTFMEFPRISLPHLEGVWMPNVHELLANISSSLQIAVASVLPMNLYRSTLALQCGPYGLSPDKCWVHELLSPWIPKLST